MTIDANAIREYVAALKPTWAGRFFYHCLPFRKQVVMDNLRRVFGDVLSAAEIEKLAKSFYSHIARSLREMLQMRFMSQAAIKRRALVKGHEQFAELLKQHRGVIVITGHFGNWEFAPIAGILNFEIGQGRFYFIRKMLKAKWLEKLLFRRYYRAGLHVIPKDNSLNQVCDALENDNIVVFVMDQHASLKAKDGIQVEFFGDKAGTYRSVATIAQYTDTPVVPAASYRLPDGRHVLEFYQPITWQEDEDRRQALYKNTLAYNQALEKMILAHPEQWLWMHKRWKAS